MPMLTRTATVIRKNRRRSSSKGSSRRGSAPTVLQPTPPSPAISPNLGYGKRTYLTPQPSPSKSVTFSYDSESKFSASPDVLSVHQGSLTASDKPNYGSVVLWKDSVDTDNSYSFLSSLCEASDESETACDFIHRAFVIIGSTWPVTVLLGLLLSLPLTMMIIGVKYLDECPKEPNIPIYLLVGGCFGSIKVMLVLCHQVKSMKDDDDEEISDEDELLTMTKMANVGLNIFLCIWFVFGNYWLFGIWIPFFRPPLLEPKNWCDRSVFTFTFWQIIICHILIGLMVTFVCSFCCCFTCIKCIKDPEKG